MRGGCKLGVYGPVGGWGEIGGHGKGPAGSGNCKMFRAWEIVDVGGSSL